MYAFAQKSLIKWSVQEKQKTDFDCLFSLRQRNLESGVFGESFVFVQLSFIIGAVREMITNTGNMHV